MNEELISMVRSIVKHGADWRINKVLNRAADALEAAEKRIAELIPKEGEWIETEMGFNNYAWVCSACGEPWVLNAGTPSENNMNYCPNCGAKMRGERNEQ